MNNMYMRSCALGITMCLSPILMPDMAKAEKTGIVNEITQSSPVSGVVKDANGDPLFGVNIVVKGTTIGSITDIDGNFSFEAPAGSTLVVSYIGFKSQEIKVKGSSPINIVLQEDSEKLDEVVVVGYGVQKKSDVTGSLSSVKGEDLTKLSISRTDQALQGQMAGVMVQNSVAAPGESPNIIIRGGNSLKGSNAPLVVIDGVLGGDLALIDPNDIASIEVLKDASSTSIYGSRGANGVIMVTTKRGKAGKPTVSYSGYISLSQISTKMDMLSGPEMYSMLKEMETNYPSTSMKIPAWIDPNNLNDVDWQDEVFRSAPMTGHSLSVSGGSETTKYSLSGNYLMHQGIIKNSDFNRAGIRANIEQQLGKRVTVGALINASRSSSSSASVNQMNGSDGGGVTFCALGFSPLVPVYDENGKFSGPLMDGAQMNNPAALINDQIVDKYRNYFQGTAFLEWEIIKNLRFKTAWTYTYSDRKQRQFVSGENLLSYKGDGYAYVNDQETTNWLGENTLTYSKVFNKDHSLNVVAGFTAEASDYFYNTNSGKGFDIESLGYWNMGLADKNLLTITSGGNHSAIASWLGRVNYAYKGKYLASVSFRADGSSKFAKNNKWGYFPSAALGWRISEEDFMKDLTWIQNLKLRASYGETGSQAIDAYQSLASFSSSSYVLNGSSAVALVPGRVPNPDLKWETTKQTDIGLDVSVFGGRISLVADYYYKKTIDLHYDKILPYYTGYSSQTQNIGSKSNKGFEFTLNTQNLVGELKWSTSLNFALNREKVLELGDDEYFYTNGSGGALGSSFNETGIVKVGEPLGNFYGYIFDGIYQNEAEVNALPGSTAAVGGVKFKDLDGDHKITTADRTIIGNANPNFIFGIGNDFSYKNFDLSFMFQGTYGNDIVNLMNVSFGTAPSTAACGNVFKYVMNDAWRGEGTSNTQQALNEGAGPMSTRFVEDGSYIRLKNLTFGYTLPKSITSKWGISNLRFYLSGQNLFTITGYSGYDPEVSSRTGNYNLGFDGGSYPSVRSYTFGLNLTL
ncbi:TonB-dependent receptor [uncultured Parabacteroides sp.]|uniref:SusC/RagA family TonB-linked outer membrane protein n=1 Tax=uncultured Parabacteroides sp. TaxID=512312 RepID=UPI0025869AAC|nr:TonB-dependent receptor [uncultured Parabacteroides sp.]